MSLVKCLDEIYGQVQGTVYVFGLLKRYFKLNFHVFVAYTIDLNAFQRFSPWTTLESPRSGQLLT